MFASHLIMRGMVEEGLTILRAARARHDGSRRNPWNDMECGSYYARALSSYALVNAFSGLTFDARVDEIGFKPAQTGDAVYFWSAGRGWGEVVFRGRTMAVAVKGGELSVARLRLPTLLGAIFVDGVKAERDGEVILLSMPRKLKAGDRLIVEGDARGEA
jgi:non-lysosomal glucosylceramidase